MWQRYWSTCVPKKALPGYYWDSFSSQVARNGVVRTLKGSCHCGRVTFKVRPRLEPARKSATLQHRARSYPDNQNSPQLLHQYPEIKQSHVAFAAEHELPQSLIDIMFRRVGAGWTPTLGVEGVEAAAVIAGKILGWDDERRNQEIDNYLDFLRQSYRWKGYEGSVN